MDVILATLFAVVAGAGTALSPCVLPVLPLVVSGGVTGGRRRPAGIAIGLAATFTVATLALAYLIDALGLPDSVLRTLAIVVLLVFGIALVVPPAAARVEAWLSRFASRKAADRAARADGFGSGLALGGALGLVYAPCAGPILAAVLTVQASQPLTAQRIVIALGYGIGTAVSVLVIVTLGRRALRGLSAYAGRMQQGLGALMVAFAFVMLGGLDLRFQEAIATKLPSALVNPTGFLEESDAVAKSLDRAPPPELELSEYGPAPEFATDRRWFNSNPLTLEGLRGKVVLIDFWTYTCINCLRTLPHLKAWDARYRDQGLQIVGVHTPEFAFEKSAKNVEGFIGRQKLAYPVVQDNDFAIWNSYSNQYWPAKYLIDAKGVVRYAHFGEGEYDETESAIRTLLAEAGTDAGAERASQGLPTETVMEGLETPETYLGSARAKGFADAPAPGTRTYKAPSGTLPTNGFALDGRWTVDEESAESVRDAAIKFSSRAAKVFLVLTSEKPGRKVRVLLDGKPIPDSLAGEDVRRGVAKIDGQRLYRLADFGKVRDAELTLELDPGISAFAFTFG